MRRDDVLSAVAEIRPVVDRLPGVDGEYLGYLADEVTGRMDAHGGDWDDGDAARCLGTLLHDARRTRRAER